MTLVAGVTSCVFGRQRAPSDVADIATGWTAEACAAASVDRDLDGLHDLCELELARAFAPTLVVDRTDCSWTGTRLGGGYFYAVQAGPDAPAIRIAYLPAYFRDCGWQGPVCATRGPGCSSHAGDSELIVVEVRPHDAAARWHAAAVFMSAHCLGRSAGRCRWYLADELGDRTWAKQTGWGPRVWVAKGKHANYPSARECDSGHWYYDSCDGNDAAYRFPVETSAQNIGSRLHPLPEGRAARGCIAADALPIRDGLAHSGTTECFWDGEARFRGWQRDGQDGATSYARVLAVVRF